VTAYTAKEHTNKTVT